MLERERRWAGPVSVCIALAIAAQVASLLAVQSADLPNTNDLAPTLRAIDSASSDLLVASLLKAVGFVFFVAPLAYLFKAASARDQGVRPRLIGVVVAGPLFLAAGAVVQQVAFNHVSADFVSQLPVKDPESTAKDLQGGSTLLQFSLGLSLAGTIGFLFGIIYTSRRAAGCGLLTRFWGTIGTVSGIALALATVAPAMAQVAIMLITVFLVYLLLLFLDRIPGRERPPAWDAGRAIPWPAPQPGRRGGLFGGSPPGPRPDPETVEGTGAEASVEPANPPRERGERRKRKRRRT